MDRRQWEKQRVWSLINFCFACFMFGLAMTIYRPTEYFYFRDTMQSKYPSEHYSLSLGAFFASGVVFSFIGSIYADKVKRVRMVFLLVNVLNICGNIFYLIHFSPWIVIFGQFIIGTAAIHKVLIGSELRRLYEPKDVTRVVSFIVLFGTVGSGAGPSLIYLFNLVHTHINNWQLNVNNTSGLVMGALYLIQLILNFFTLSDLSQCEIEEESEVCLLQSSSMPSEGDNENNENSSSECREQCKETSYVEDGGKRSFKETYIAAIKVLFSNKFTILLYSFSFLGQFAVAWILALTPVSSAQYLDWAQVHVAMVNLVSFFAGSISTALAINIISNHIKDVDMLMYNLAVSFLGLLTFLLFPFVADELVQTVLIYIANILINSYFAAAHVQSTAMLMKLVPREIQGFSGALRNASLEVSSMAASLTVPVVTSYMVPFFSIHMFITLISFVWTCYHRQDFIDLKMMTIN